MQDLAIGGVLGVLFLLVLFFLAIYMQIKVIQFVVVAVNLYKEMIQNQKRIIKLLKKNIPPEQGGAKIEIQEKKCPSCGTINEADSKFCDGCGMQLS